MPSSRQSPIVYCELADNIIDEKLRFTVDESNLGNGTLCNVYASRLGMEESIIHPSKSSRVSYSISPSDGSIVEKIRRSCLEAR